MNIGIDYGHGTGEDRGAEGYLNEEKVIREYGPLIIVGFQKLGHIVYNITPTQAGLTLGQSLAYRVNKANSLKLDVVISCHVNAFETDKAQGCEVEYISASGKVYADRICTEIAKLGYVNRGSQSRTNLYVLKYTNAVAILVEPFFCDTKTDCNKYNAIKLANAIVKGVTGQDVYLDAPVVESKPFITTNYIPKGAYGIDTAAFTEKYFKGLRVYYDSNAKGMWAITQYLTDEQCTSIAALLKVDNLLYSTK